MSTDPRVLLRRHFGYPSFRPGQEELVRAAIGGSDALGVLPTGGGKSVCYQVPAHALGGMTLVITPLVSLMEDQVRRAREAGLRGAYLSASQSSRDRSRTLAEARQGALDILFVAPERLEIEAFQVALGELGVQLLAVDEAHCISEWGHEFRPAYRRIARIRRRLKAPVLALTATATPEVRDDIIRSLELRNPRLVVRSFDRPNLSWSIRRVRDMRARVRETYRILTRRPGPGLVYAPTRGMVERARDALAGFGLRALAYHAGLSGEERTAVQAAFMANDCRVVVATNAFGMGIDKADVRTVVHLALPSTLEAYYQEAGRAGRDGEPAACLAFFAPDDVTRAKKMIDRTYPPVRHLRAVIRRLARQAAAFSERQGDPTPPIPTAVLGGVVDQGTILEALERMGAVTRIRAEASGGGTEDPFPGSESSRWRFVTPHVEFGRARDRRATVVRKLGAVRHFARTRGCRRRLLLRYFGEVAPRRCGCCDRCAGAFLFLE